MANAPEVTRDALGLAIGVGSKVLYADVDDGFVFFEHATVTRLTPKKVEIEFNQRKYASAEPRSVKMLTTPSRIVFYPEIKQ